jgi:hypothetical protein
VAENRNRWLEIILTAFIGALIGQFFALGLAGINLLVIVVTVILIGMVLFEFALSPRLREQTRVQSLQDYLDELKEEVTRLEKTIDELVPVVEQEIEITTISSLKTQRYWGLTAEQNDTQNIAFKSLLQRLLESTNDVLNSQQQNKRLKKETDKFQTTSIDVVELSRLEKEAGKVAEALDNLDDTLRQIKIQVNSYRVERLQLILPIESESITTEPAKSQPSPSRLEDDDKKSDLPDDEDKGDEDKPSKRRSKK